MSISDNFAILWPLTRGDPAVVVAMLDGPVDLSHPCLAGADLEILCVGDPPASPDVGSSRHGTHVASQIFAGPDCPVEGIAPGCRGLVIPVYGSDPEGRLLATTQIDLARAIHLAIGHGAHIINISGGQLSPSDEANHFLANALALCEQEGILVVAAAGNDGCECLHVPAAIGSVIAVGAYDPASGKPADFSNWGSAYRSNGLLAPGTQIAGANSAGGTATQSGTSFAAPIVAGAAALLMSLQVQRGGAIDARAVRSALLGGAERCDESGGADCRGFLAGKLDVGQALGLLFPDSAGSIAVPIAAVHASAAAAEPPDSFVPIVPRPPAGLLPAIQEPQTETPEQKEGKLMLNEIISAGATVNPGGGPDPVAGGIAPSGQAAIFEPAAGVTPSGGCGCAGGAASEEAGGCGCEACAGTGSSARQLVFALGELAYDLGTEAHRDSLTQAMNGANPLAWDSLAKHLEQNPWDAEAVTWTLNIDSTPIYAIRPCGPFAAETYRRLAAYLVGQMGGTGKNAKATVDRISLPGWIEGSVTLATGEVVPVVEPALRGLYAWETKSLVQAVTAAADSKAGVDSGVSNFLQRVYYELRNLGVAPQERALNFAATSAFQAETVFTNAMGRNLVLDLINVEKSPICRQDSDCWDVILTFFDPANDRAARDVFRFTVDVSDVIPVTVGPVRNWFVR